MEQQFLFKAQKADGSGWIEGDLIQNDKHTSIRLKTFHENNGWLTYEINPKTICQFTGKLLNGQKLFSGDRFIMRNNIIKVVRYNPDVMAFQIANEHDLKNESTVQALGDSLWQTPNPDWWTMFRSESKIIGNIHDKQD